MGRGGSTAGRGGGAANAGTGAATTGGASAAFWERTYGSAVPGQMQPGRAVIRYRPDGSYRDDRISKVEQGGGRLTLASGAKFSWNTAAQEFVREGASPVSGRNTFAENDYLQW